MDTSLFRHTFRVAVTGTDGFDVMLGKTTHKKACQGGIDYKDFLVLYFPIPYVERTSHGLRAFADMQAFSRLVAMDGVPPRNGYGAITVAVEEAFRRGLTGQVLTDIKRGRDVRGALVGYAEGRMVGLKQLRGILEAIYRLGLALGEEVDKAVVANRERWTLRERHSFLARLRRIVARWMGRAGSE